MPPRNKVKPSKRAHIKVPASTSAQTPSSPDELLILVDVTRNGVTTKRPKLTTDQFAVLQTRIDKVLEIARVALLSVGLEDVDRLTLIMRNPEQGSRILVSSNERTRDELQAATDQALEFGWRGD